MPLSWLSEAVLRRPRPGRAKVVGPAHSTRRWWRLSRAWQLVQDYEEACGHEHEFVMKMRTDAALSAQEAVVNEFGVTAS